MPREIIGGKNKQDELHFVITGSVEVKPYTVEMVYKESKEMLNDNLSGIQAARRLNDLPIEFKGMETIVSDFCVNQEEKRIGGINGGLVLITESSLVKGFYC